MRVERLEDIIMGSAGEKLNIHHPTFVERVRQNELHDNRLKEKASRVFDLAAEKGIHIVETHLDPQPHGIQGSITPLRRVFRLAFLAPESAQLLSRDRLIKQTVTVGVHDLLGKDHVTGETNEFPVASCDVITTLNVVRRRGSKGTLVRDPNFSPVLDGRQVIERFDERYPVFHAPHAGQYIPSILPFNDSVVPRAEGECADRQAQMKHGDIVNGIISSLEQVEHVLNSPVRDFLQLFPNVR